MSQAMTRRGVLAGAAALVPMMAAGQETRAKLPTPPSVVTEPPRQWGRHAPPEIYPDPDVLVIDPSFKDYLVGLAAIHRLSTGFDWAEGPAWSGEGEYVLFSDVKGNTQYRYIWETGDVTEFRKPSWRSNGNTFDFQGRQVSCQDYFRRVVRWEPSGAMTIIADSFEGKPLNSPNDLVPHPDGSIWFTDPPYGDQLTEGHPDVAGGRANPRGLDDPTLTNNGVGLVGGTMQQLPENTYRWDPSGRLDVVVPGSQVPDPNGICFSPDYKTLYLISTGPGPGDNGHGGKGVIYAFDVQGTKLSNMRVFSDCMVDGVHCGPDGMRADRAGNLWVGSNAPLGYCGVTVWNPAGKLIGRIRLPEVCANLCFAGPKRDYLFMAASQSIYMLLVNVQGAAPG
ncbi:MAG TPA: SMP-30/gluconolactonase/LRE family protein [Acetobacteraceae bacterium]|nr:SMP-30/gluconolactonase/LRE family protein [Acetobacteraceae bacterium]